MTRGLRRDVLAGLMFIGFAAWGGWAAADLDPGTATDMGPGFFPRMLIGVLLGFGFGITVAGLLQQASDDWTEWTLRPIGLVSLAGIAFAVLLPKGGIVAAVAATTTIGSLAGGRPRPVAIVLLSAALVMAAIALFVLGLGMPLPIWPSW